MPIDNAPGSVFLYDTGSTFMLSAILQKVTGQKVVEYLQPRLFDPLQIQQKIWESSPLGINTGGWGLSVTTETLAKFGQLYLQQGQWNGQQLLPTQWVSEATRFKIQQPAVWNSGSDPANQAAYSASLADPVAALGKLKQSSDFNGDACSFSLSNATADFEINCGLGTWRDGSTTLPGEPPGLLPRNDRDTSPIKVAAAGAWKDANTFQMLWHFYETPHHDIVTCSFDGAAVQIEFSE